MKITKKKHFLNNVLVYGLPFIIWLALYVILINLYKLAPGMDLMKKANRIASINLGAPGLNIVMNTMLIPAYSSPLLLFLQVR